MRSSSWWLVAGAALLLPGLLARPRARAPVRKGAQRQTIALSSVYSTSGQRGLKRVKAGLGKVADHAFEEMRRESLDCPSHIFLVGGKGFPEAMIATRWAMAGARDVDEPVQPDDQKPSPECWVVVYVGRAGSSPPAWLVKSVERTGTTIRVTISTPERDGSTKDLHEYLFWAPVGKLKEGTWTLELYMAEKKRVTLLRRVDVPPGSE